MTTSSQEIKITLPTLHGGKDGSGGQLEIAEHPARFKVVMCGRRWGKTILGVFLCLKTGVSGGRAWWVAPNYKIANEGWVELKRLARQINEFFAAGGIEIRIEIRESDRQIIFPSQLGGGMVEVRSSDVEGSLRGAGLDGVVIDEAASHRESVWTEELRPALIDKRGWCLFIGTPKGDNWFTKLHSRAASGSFPNWAAWKRITWDNPLISDEERKEIEEEYTGRPDKYAQEILADIGASQYLVYPQFNRDVHMWKWALPRFVEYIGGLDFGGDQVGSHKSAGIISGITDNDEMVCIREFEESGPNITERQMAWMADTENRLKLIHGAKGYPPPKIFWNADRSQMKFIDILKTYGYRISKTKGGSGSVRAGIDLVSSRLAIRGDGKPRFYYLPTLTKLPEHFESYHNPEPSDDPEHVMPDNPVKVADDLDDAIRYMVEKKDGRVYGDPNKLYARSKVMVGYARN